MRRELKAWVRRNPRRWVIFDVLAALAVGLALGALAGAGF